MTRFGCAPSLQVETRQANVARMADLGALLEAVYGAPADDEPRSVYSDVLLERGERLGEFISLQLARTAKGKRTATREKALLAAEGAGWWRDHPCTQFGTVRWEDTSRGFPAVFRQSWSVNGEEPTERALIATARNPAWNTVETMSLSYDLVSAEFAQVFRTARLTSLRAIDGLNVRLLEHVADLPLAVTSLELWLREDRDVPKVTGFPALRHLTVDMRATPARVVAALSASELIGRLQSLELRGVARGTVQDALAALATVPPNVERLTLNRFNGQWVTLTGARARPEVEISMTAHQLDEVLESLRTLDAKSVASLKVTFAEGGFFTRKSRPLFAEKVRAALTKLGDRGTLDAG